MEIKLCLSRIYELKNYKYNIYDVISLLLILWYIYIYTYTLCNTNKPWIFYVIYTYTVMFVAINQLINQSSIIPSVYRQSVLYRSLYITQISIYRNDIFIISCAEIFSLNLVNPNCIGSLGNFQWEIMQWPSFRFKWEKI